MAPPVNIILGAGSIGDSSRSPFAKFDTPEQVNSYLDVFYERGYRQVDSARAYAPEAPGSSEDRLGAVDAGKRFAIDSKALVGEGGGWHSKENIWRSIDDSLKVLKVDQMNVYYLHVPERSTPFEDAHEALDEAHRAGKIKKFGISNHTPEEVEQFIARADTKGLVKPTVYQGQYNALVRGGEKELFPLLRKHGIVFYAYSPSAGGFFAAIGDLTKENTRFTSPSRVSSLYKAFYDKPQLVEAAQKVAEAAAKHNISGHAAALRWTAYHSILDASLGDAIIIGASKIEQLKENLDIIEAGPLPEDLAEAVGEVYQHVGDADIKPWF